ncbi:hypothetical protein M885DRAFT_605025 [Pelagophyceae sp. CCMP2097]|nr:hypothetical protein M885DRAFT_605025 [Pelagophyceae sp. CCMP2097]
MSLWRAAISKNMHELRFQFCPKAEHSENIKNYIRNNYWDLKTLNPTFPFLVRVYDDERPQIIATYAWYHKEYKNVEGLTEAQINTTLRDLVLLPEVDSTIEKRSWPATEDLPGPQVW